MSNQIVNISYLKTFVSGVLTVNQGSYADSYCPTYEQLTDGTFVVNYVANNNPTSTTNGIKVNGTYADNQLVKREDLTMLYQILQSVNVSTNSTTISCCGGSATLSTTAYFKLRTVKESETTDASANTSASVTATYSNSKSYTSISGSKITFTKNSINYPTSTSAAARTTTVTGKYTYSSTTKEDTVDIKQNANSVDSSWTNTTQTTTSIGVTDSLSFGAGGGTKNYTVTRYYTQYQEKYDSCGALMDSNSYGTSTTVTPTSYTTSNSAFICTSNSVTVGAQDSGAEERSGTLTVKWGSFQDTCSLSQSSNAIDDSWTATGDPYTYSYSVTVSPWNDLSCGGGTTYATAKLSWKQDYVKYDSLGAIVSSKTENESSDVTNSTTWSTTRGSISSSGVLTYPASTSTGEIRTTVTGKYGTYQDTDYMTQTACGSTGYTYQILSVTFASSSIGKCDTTAPAVTVNARSGKTNSDGSTTWYDAKDLSTSDYTISYNPSLSQNTSSSERTITATVKYKTVQKTETFTQDAGPCDTESTRTEYNLRVLNLSIEKCATTASPTVQGCSRTVTSHTDGSDDEYGNWSDWSNLSSSNYSLSFNPSIETNETTSTKTYTVTATGKGNYYGITSSATITQAAGPCAVQTGTTTDYKIQVLDASIGKCETTASPTVQGSSRTGTTYSDGTPTSWGTWSDWSNLTSSDYSISFNPNIGANQTSEAKTYTATVTGKGNYAGKSDTATITQNAGPCDITSITTEYDIQVIASTIEACDTSASPTVQGRSRNNTANTSSSTVDEGAWSTWSNLSSSNYSLSYSPSISINQTSEAKTYTVTVTGKGNYANLTHEDSFSQKAGPCCTVGFSWSSLSVTASTVAKCDTSGSFTVKANGTYTNSSCSTSATSSTLSSSDYTIKYGTSSGSYTLNSITENNTSSSKTWYYKITASSTYGSLTYTGSFTQSAGPCQDTYVFSTTMEDETFNSTTTKFIYITSTKNGSKFSDITLSGCDWVTKGSITEHSVYDYQTYISVDDLEGSTPRSCTLTIEQGESGNKETYNITQNAYEFDSVFNPLEGVTIASSGVTYTPQWFLSKKNGSYCSMTVTPSCDWVTVNNVAEGTVGSNGNCIINISFAENTSTESRSCTVKFLQDGSKRYIERTFTQAAGAKPYIVIESFGTDLQPCQTEITDEINGPTVMYYTGETDYEGVELVLGTDYFFDNFDTYTDCSDVNDTRTIEIRAFGNGKYVGLTSEPFSIDQVCCAEEEAVSYTVSFNDLTYNAGIEQLEMTSGDADIISGGENDSACTWRCYSDCTVQLKFYNSSSKYITFRLSGDNFSINDGEILNGKTLSPGQSVSYTITTYLSTNADTVIELIEE